MRAMLLSLALLAAPAAAAEAPRPTPPTDVEVSRVLADPATADTVARAMQALSGAFLNLPVGEMEAALAGRTPTAADRRRTIREVERAKNPRFEQDLQRQIAGSRVAMQASMKAMADAMPAMMKGMAEARDAMERAIANMPSPAYPRR